MISKIYDFLSDKGKVGEHLQTALVAIVLVERLVLMVAAGLITGGLIGRIVTGGKYTFEGAVLGLILFGYEFYDPAKWWPFKFFSIEGVIDAFVDEPLEKRQEKADFSRIRYNWEKSNAEEKFGYSQNVRVFDDYKPVDDNGNLATTIFERVLSDTEIARTEKAIRKKKVSLSYYLNFDDYRNEYSVCNGIELLKKITYPKNAEGIDFLFRCMWDVDEAYFIPAVELLMSYPKDMVRRKIEEEIKIAFENEDVVRIGGLMFLADKQKYEIRFLEEIRENQNVNEEMHQLLTFPQI